MCTNIPWIAATNIGNAVGTKSYDNFFIISTNTRKPVGKFILFCKSESKTPFLLIELLATQLPVLYPILKIQEQRTDKVIRLYAAQLSSQ